MDSSSFTSRPVFEDRKTKRGPIPIPIVEPTNTKSSFITKPKRKRIIGSVPLFKTEWLESESEINSLPLHSNYIQNVLKRKTSHDPTFGVYQDDTDGSFKLGRSSSKYNDKRVFLVGKKYKSTQDLCELLPQSRPDKRAVTFQDRRAYKQIILQSNAHRVNCSPSGKMKGNKGLKYTRFISKLFTDKKEGNH